MLERSFFLSDRSRVWMCRTVCFGHCFIAAWFPNVLWNSIRSLLKTNDSLNWIELQCQWRGDNRRKELQDFQINVPGLTVQRWIKFNLFAQSASWYVLGLNCGVTVERHMYIMNRTLKLCMPSHWEIQWGRQEVKNSPHCERLLWNWYKCLKVLFKGHLADC